jgi:phytoene synthase
MPSTSQAQLSYAYASCRSIARSAARNFYYAFLALPREKRNALCAVYAFMRRADDISDDQSLSINARHQKLDDWRQQAHAAFAGNPTDDAILLAVSDAQHRFNIPVELFDQLIRGTAMDLQYPASSAAHPIAPYRNFDELYAYCYHVASVVGLVCIHIFGFKDAKAKQLAERCGIAFQLTNILRDVREDALMGRIYFPQQDLAMFNLKPDDLSVPSLANGFRPKHFRGLLEFEAQRAREFYRSGRELLPLINADSRPALWALIEIYSRLLQKIADADYDVFSARVSVRAPEKILLLSRALMRRLKG